MDDAMATQTIMVTVEAVDTTPMAPTVVMATVDDSDPGSTSVTVTWTGAGAECVGHGVVLFSNNFTEWQGYIRWLRERGPASLTFTSTLALRLIHRCCGVAGRSGRVDDRRAR